MDREIDRSLELLKTMSFEELQRRGWHLQPNNYVWPLNDVGYLRGHPQLWMGEGMPNGIEVDLDEQEQLMLKIAAHADELADVPDKASRPGEFAWCNRSFGWADAYSYYGLVRELRPRRVIEVGAGSSTLVLARALAANADECDVTLIEPQPNRGVLGEPPAAWRMLESGVQEVALEVFEALGPGDILFYDGSHAVRTGSDVNWLFFEVLPRLARGVWIHVHDIFWPHDYPPEWVLDEGLSWNEQYLVQAFLMHNSDYRLRLAVHMLWVARRERIEPHLPAGANGVSIWIEKVA